MRPEDTELASGENERCAEKLQSDTPRTDDVAVEFDPDNNFCFKRGSKWVPIEDVYRLERELAYAISRSEEELEADRAMTRGVALAEAALSANQPAEKDGEGPRLLREARLVWVRSPRFKGGPYPSQDEADAFEAGFNAASLVQSEVAQSAIAPHPLLREIRDMFAAKLDVPYPRYTPATQTFLTVSIRQLRERLDAALDGGNERKER